MVLSSLRSHFFKHLSCTTPTTTTTTTFFFSARHIRQHITPHTSLPARFPVLSSPFQTRNQWGLNSITTTKFSTTAFPDIPATSSFTAPYLSVQIQCQKNVADMLSEALLCFGASSISREEEGNNENDDEESFHPVEITKGLWVVPEWRTPPDLQATNIILNPGLTFGTGEHPTTKLCLLLLRSIIKGGEFFLDYGTGSGLLAIAAIKFGAGFSVGLDVDPQAIRSARHNALLNNIGAEKLQLHLVPSKKSCPTTDEAMYGGVEGKNSSGTGIISETEKYDVVIANILLNPLLDLADHIVSYAKPGALVGVSGIISEQIPYIVERYSQLLEGISVSKMDDWACVSGNKKRNLIAT